VISCVLDTVVSVRGLINPRGYCGRIVFEHAGAYRLIVSATTVQEMIGVLDQPSLARKIRGIAGLDRDAVMRAIAAAKVVEPETISAISRDPKDDAFLAVSAAAGADYLVSEDNDLLAIGEYDGVRIVVAAAFLTILETSDPPG
jgi:putative PIN family toxin of toxin-antitoxin system